MRLRSLRPWATLGLRSGPSSLPPSMPPSLPSPLPPSLAPLPPSLAPSLPLSLSLSLSVSLSLSRSVCACLSISLLLLLPGGREQRRLSLGPRPVPYARSPRSGRFPPVFGGMCCWIYRARDYLHAGSVLPVQKPSPLSAHELVCQFRSPCSAGVLHGNAWQSKTCSN